MSKRIWLPMLCAIVLLATITAFTGTSLWVYVDLASLVVVPLAPLVYLALAYGGKGFASAFRASSKDGATRRELEASADFFKNLGSAMWSFGAIGSASGIIAVLVNLTDKAKIGPNIAISLITMLYAAFFNALLALPFLTAARQRLALVD